MDACVTHAHLVRGTNTFCFLILPRSCVMPPGRKRRGKGHSGARTDMAAAPSDSAAPDGSDELSKGVTRSAKVSGKVQPPTLCLRPKPTAEDPHDSDTDFEYVCCLSLSFCLSRPLSLSLSLSFFHCSIASFCLPISVPAVHCLFPCGLPSVTRCPSIRHTHSPWPGA